MNVKKKGQKWIEQRAAAILKAHDVCELDAVMRPFSYEKGVGKVLLLMVEADEQTVGGIFLPNGATLNFGEAIVVDIDDRLEQRGDLDLNVGDRVMVAPYMGSKVELREKWVDPVSGEDRFGMRNYVTIDPAHILNKFEVVE